jgi:hypothetical protein
LWAIPGVDVEFVPSPTTRTQLLKYLEQIALSVPEIAVTPYPVDPRLGEALTHKECMVRQAELAPKGKSPLKVMVPVSGAAVQLDYIKNLLIGLPQDGNVKVTLVARQSSQTHQFLDWCQDNQMVTVLAHWLDREVVEMYEKALEAEVFGVEVTKPSEQAFKVLLTPKTHGGVIMLFSEPVGRQEDDNLMFMRRHGLLPSLEEQKEIAKRAVDSGQCTDDFLKKARAWRGLMLPTEGAMAAKAIMWYRQSGLLAAMGEFSGYVKGHPELSGHGVREIWEKLSGLIE